MLFKQSIMKISKIILSILSLLLCSFKCQSNDISNDDLANEISLLNTNMDRTYCTGEENFNYDNELSDDDKDRMSEFVQINNNHISLDDNVYSEFKVNRLGISPDEFNNYTGTITLPYNPFNPGTSRPSLPPETYRVNQQKINFVKSNMELMNNLCASNDCLINTTGELFIPPQSEPYYTNSSSMQIFNFKLSWFKVTFVADHITSFVIGVCGMLTHFNIIDDIRMLANVSYSQLNTVFLNTINDVASEISNYMLDTLSIEMINLINTALTLETLFTAGNLTGIVCTVIMFIFSHWFPPLLKSVYIIIGAYLYHYRLDCTIGLWWSQYNILTF